MAGERSRTEALLFVASGLAWIAAAIGFATGRVVPASGQATIGISLFVLALAKRRRSRTKPPEAA